jgi:hypothetical protein
MSNDDFRDLVKRMRNLQKEYFSTRRKAALDRAKKLEREVDVELDSKAKADQLALIPIPLLLRKPKGIDS